MVVRRQYADKGVGIQKRPPPPPKINVDNLIVDDKVKLLEKQTSSKKKEDKKSKLSSQIFGIPRCGEVVLLGQSREPESSHRRSSGGGDTRDELRDTGRARSRGRSQSAERRVPSPRSPGQRSLPRPTPPKEFAIAPSAAKRSKSLTKTSTKPSTNSKAKLFRASEAKEKAAVASAKAQKKKLVTPPKWNQLLYGSKSFGKKSLVSTKKAVVDAQKNTVPAQKKVVRVNVNDPPGIPRSPSTRSRNSVVLAKPDLDDTIIAVLDKCIGNFDLYDCLEDTGVQVEYVQQSFKDADESTMPGKVKLLFQKSTETYQETQKQIGERYELSMKAMAEADEGRRPQPKPEPDPEPEPEEESSDDTEIPQKNRNMDFAVEVTTDTAHENNKSLSALLEKPQPQEVSAAASNKATAKDQNAASPERQEEETTKKKKIDLTPIKKEINHGLKQAKRSASRRLGLYLQGLAKDLIDPDAAENLCCSAFDSTGLDEEDVPKSIIEEEIEERQKRANRVPSVTNEQQQQQQQQKDIPDTAQVVAPNGTCDNNSGNEAADETDIKENTAKISQEGAPNSVPDAGNIEVCKDEENTESQARDDSYLYSPFKCTFPLESKDPDEEKESKEEDETSTARIERKFRELVQLMDEQNVKKSEKCANAEEKEEESNIEEKEVGCEMDKRVSEEAGKITYFLRPCDLDTLTTPSAT